MAHTSLLVLSTLLIVLTFSGHFYAAASPAKARAKALEPIDPLEKYQVGWELSGESGTANARITFNIVVETQGFVGFGFSPNGNMLGSDVIIAGVYDNRTTYFSDRHVVGYSEPVVDESQDWEATSITQNATHTSIVVTRLLDTCDTNDDLPITADTMRLIWSYGATDTPNGHGGNRGTVAVNLLDPPMPPFDGEGLDVWTLTMNATMPAQETTYWCSIHKSPSHFNTTRQAVGFDIRLDTPTDVKHTHHLVVFICNAPSGQDPEELFGPYVGQEGGDCFKDAPYTDFHHYCRSIIYAWAVGGKMMALPEDIGLPITENGETQYMMIEMHYDNPEVVSGVRVTSLLDFYTTTALRPVQAQIGVIMTEMNFTHVLPPNQADYVTVTHCSSECTADFIPPTGTFIFNILLHAHKAGRKMKFRHWRDGVELPWIISDEHYDFDFQQNRPLKEPRHVLPGDHLALECTTDTRNRGNNVTIAGYGTMEEMCQVIFFAYPRGSFGGCSSWHDQPKFLSKIGIEGVSWENLMDAPIISAPPTLAGLSYEDYLNTNVSWTPQLVAELQNAARYTEQVQLTCGSLPEQPVHYPAAEDYIPEDTCSALPTTTTESPFCPPTGAHNFPYPGNCSLYIRCINGHEQVLSCAPLIFDKIDLTCKPQGEAVCDEEGPPFKCSTDGYEIHPHWSNCSKYVECFNEEVFETDCAANTYFDARPEMLRCNLAEAALCNSECSAAGVEFHAVRARGCKWYKICIEGHSTNLQCHDDTVYSPTESRCVPPVDYNCPYTIRNVLYA